MMRLGLLLMFPLYSRLISQTLNKHTHMRTYTVGTLQNMDHGLDWTGLNCIGLKIELGNEETEIGNGVVSH